MQRRPVVDRMRDHEGGSFKLKQFMLNVQVKRHYIGKGSNVEADWNCCTIKKSEALLGEKLIYVYGLRFKRIGVLILP